MNSTKPTCQMTMSDNGKNPLGVEKFWECGKPAKATIESNLRGKIFVCGLHARAHDRMVDRYKHFEKSKPL